MQTRDGSTNPVEGEVKWASMKSLWFSVHFFIALIGGYFTFSWDAVLIAFLFTVTTLCLGHTIGLHRLMIHRSFECPKWLEYFLVHLGTLVGMGGPFKMIYLHDIRDWSQRHDACHAYFIHQTPLWKDFLWQNHCRVSLKHPPRFVIEEEIATDRVYQWLDKTWMWQQLPWAVLLYLLGGIGYVIWGISVRIIVSLLGHWYVGFIAHNEGKRDWFLKGHAIQGYNIPLLGFLAMGEGWHNNHHAFPESARLGHNAAQPDPGWWMLSLLKALGLAWNLKTPKDQTKRPELIPESKG